MLGWLVVRTGSIFPAMAMHAMYDITQLAYVSFETHRQGAQKLLAEATTKATEPINAWVLAGGALLIAISLMLFLRTRSAKPQAADAAAQPALS